VVGLIEIARGIRLVRWSKLYSSICVFVEIGRVLEAPPPDLSKRLLALGGCRGGAASFSAGAEYPGRDWRTGCLERSRRCMGGRMYF